MNPCAYVYTTSFFQKEFNKHFLYATELDYMLSALLSVVVVVVVVSVGDFSPTGVMLSGVLVGSLKCSLYTPLRGFIHCKLVM